MTDNITVFIGSKNDFNDFINKQIEDDEKTIPFMELIQHYNARLRPTESGVKEHDLSDNIVVDNCIVRADDYGSVLEHVLTNFVNIVAINYDIEHLYIHNPPRKVLESLESFYDDIQYKGSQYVSLDRDKLREIYIKLCNDILGQKNCKKKMMSGMYRLITKNSDKPAVLMLYGPSGVGKTESAKSISRTMGGELLRIQFSMMQSNEAYNYIFGAEHSKNSLARDMLARESNVILIDEFDKVDPNFYNAFYELFDEGIFVDTNYRVDLRHTIIILTGNFESEEDIKRTLGPAMFSRIGACIQFEDITTEQKCDIIDKWYTNIVNNLEHDEKIFINKTDILSWFKENAERYDNIRILKTKLENAVFEKLTMEFIMK